MSFVLPLAIGVAIGETAWGAIATQGAFVALYGNDAPYRRRARVLVAASVAMVVAIGAGTLLTSVSPWAAALGAGLVGGGAALLMLAIETGAPREFPVVLTYLVSTGLPADASDAPHRMLLVLVGASIVTAAAMLPALARPRGPEEDAVRIAFRATGRLVAAIGDAAADERRHEAVLALRRARLAMVHAGSPDASRERLTAMTVALETVLDAAIELVAAGSDPIHPGWASALDRLAGEVGAEGPPARDPDRIAPPGEAGARFADAVDRAELAADPERAFAATIVPFRRPRPARRGARLRRALRPSSVLVPTAARVGIAAAAGTGLGLALGVTRGYWVGLTAVTVLQASNVQLVARRTVHRAIGTAVGVALAALLVHFHPGIWPIVVAIALCLTISQLFVVGSYGVAVAFLTPVAVLLFDLARPGAPLSPILGARLLDTAIGCVIGLGAARFLWPRTAASRLPAAHADVVQAVRDVLHAAQTRSTDRDGVRVRRARRRLSVALLNLRAIQADANGDLLWSTREGDERWRITVLVERLAYAALAFPDHRDREPDDPALVDRCDEALDLLAAVAERHRSPRPVEVPVVPGHPVLSGALRDLRDGLGAGEGDEPGDASVGSPVPAVG